MTHLDYLRAHQYLYYCKAQPVISDYDYDKFGVWSGEDYKGGSDSESHYTEEQKSLALKLSHKPFPEDYK